MALARALMSAVVCFASGGTTRFAVSAPIAWASLSS